MQQQRQQCQRKVGEWWLNCRRWRNGTHGGLTVLVGLLVPLLALQLFLVDFALCEEHTTEVSAEGLEPPGHYGAGKLGGSQQQQGGPNKLGAAWQIFGSNAMRQSEGRLVKTKQRKTKPHQKDSRAPLPPGKIMMAPPRRRNSFNQNASIAIDRSSGLSHPPIGGGGVGAGGGMGGGGGNVYGSLNHYDGNLYGIRGGGGRRDNDGIRPFGERFGPVGQIGGYHRHPEDDVFRSEDELLLESAGAGGNGGKGGTGGDGSGSMVGGLQHCDIKCEPREFLCDKSCACIHMDLHCDGQADCVLTEDEQNCEAVHQLLAQQIKDNCETSGTHVICATTHTCISRDWLCDGDDDCGDYTDETHCGSRLDCTDGKFECQNGMCIPHDWVCDGDNDCNDLSDERNCTKQCTRDEFRCKDGSCISASFQCDGETDCIDESDEANCDQPMQNCPEGEYKCKGALGGMGGPGGRCVLLRFRCDGDNDCGDWSDEENCPKKQVDCMINEFRCDDGDCIPLQWRCDDKQDCNNGEDEKSCPVDRVAGHVCSQDEYTCKDGRCILRTWVCDGAADCRRGEDEQDCDIKCELNQFLCPTGTRNSSRDSVCINQKHVCDGHSDCVNGEDEQRCPIAHPCGAHARCEQLCVTAYSGREECMCRPGWLLHGNGYNCTDIDECTITSSPVCSQQCTNVAGSFRCSCQPGYVLRPDQRTCKAVGGSVKLLMANRADIRQVSLSNNQYTSIAKGLPNAIALDYHYRQDLLFWTDVSIDVIKRSHLNGSGVRDVVKWGLESPGGLAVDWIHDLLFWTDSGTRRVEVSTFDGQMRAVIAANELDKPRAIAVHPGRATVFWTDWGTSPRIERAYMDGSERQTLISEAIFWPNGLTIDYTSDRLYWADAKHVIESAGLDGRGRRKILSNNLPHPFALALFEDSMYWTDWHTKTISTASKVNGRGFRVVHEGLHFPMGIQSYHPSRQPDYPNRCPPASDAKGGIGRRGGCSHLCLPNRAHRRCACPIGLTLRPDGRTCSTVPNKLLLIVRKKDVRVRQLDSPNPVDMVLPLDGIKSTVAVDWCSRTNVIYWTDVGKSMISRAFINGSGQEPIIRSNLISPAGLAFDWITEKIYWTDPGTNRIEAATTDGRHRALLIWERLDKPRDIVVHPGEGYMFWSDWGSNPLIERAGMDGSGRYTLVSENLQWPNGLALDVDKQRLYFLDGGTKSLEYVNYDGTGRNRLLQEGLHHPFGLDVYERRVYWTDWDTHSIQVADMYTGQDRRTILANNSDLMDIRVFHRNRRDTPNPCAHNNGGCSYICLLNPTSYSCACPIGIQLKDNGKTCKAGPSNYLIFAHRTEVRQVSLDSDYQIDVVLPLPPISNVVALDVDRRTGEIYWADTIEDVIMRSTPDGMRIKQIYSESMTSVDGLVIDSIGRKLYWTDAGRKVLEVSDLEDGSRSALIWRELEQPRGIALDYESGLLFWSDWGAYPRIERANMDGEARINLITEGLGWPNGLAVDRTQRRIYWADAQMKTIESCSLSGTFRARLAENLPHPYALAVTTHHIYWTDWITKALHTVPKVGPAAHPIRNVTHGLEGLMDVKVVQEEDGRQLENVCGPTNGGCSHLCLRNPTGYSCKCPTGLTMRDGSTTDCKTLPDEFLLIALRSGIGRISLDTPDLFDVVLPIDGVHGAVVLDYHYDSMQLYYADVNVDAIRRVNMQNYSDTQVVVASGLNTPNGIAVDWLADNLYWTDTALKKIEVARLDGSCRKAVLTDGLDDPHSIILYPKRGFLFWADWGATPKIERAYMDGSGRRNIIDFELGFPTGLAIDFDTKKLYWADAVQDRIELCDFDGRRRTQVVAHATHPFGFTLTGTHLFWTDWYNKSVLRAPKDSVTSVEVARFSLRGALEVRSVSGSRQPHDWNPCRRDNGGCSHLCLFAETRYACACPDVPDPTGRSCHLEPTFVVPMKPNDEMLSASDERPIKSNGSTVLSSSKMHAQLVIIATAILAGLLIVVIIAILVLIVNSKRKQTKKCSRSASDVLTFTNPNYNGMVDSLCTGTDVASISRNTIWKRLKYDRAQERVFEEKYLGVQHTSGGIGGGCSNSSGGVGGGSYMESSGKPSSLMAPGSAALPV
ncbi:low-density lipoprotein receptor-related protein 4 [Anopheles darlingi]|uniref:low-density lipoprotein receptor-related protein 4 n=1 Tax=Anopheles darlingi TaxID=43151 RepID=UPI0021002A09|nr:low-density lipoprotein receptor-related protein 4 [Anopheles darlingi]